jgi:shikimate dehydrogenase
MRKFGLIGYPLGHSFSKKYFTEKFQNERIQDCSYELYPVENINILPELIRNERELTGLNVTIPYKTSVMSLLDEISAEAEAVGAVNTIKIKRNAGKAVLYGFNSDVTGFRDSLLPYLRSDIKSAIILGTGGSSSAVSYVLKKLGMKVILVSRVKGKGSVIYADLDPGILSDTFLIVNATPLGMFPDIEGKPAINYNLLGPKHIPYDLVYNPEKTAFLKMGRERGCVTISGLRMLHLQAEKSWEIWNDDSL